MSCRNNNSRQECQSLQCIQSIQKKHPKVKLFFSLPPKEPFGEVCPDIFISAKNLACGYNAKPGIAWW